MAMVFKSIQLTTMIFCRTAGVLYRPSVCYSLCSGSGDKKGDKKDGGDPCDPYMPRKLCDKKRGDNPCDAYLPRNRDPCGKKGGGDPCDPCKPRKPGGKKGGDKPCDPYMPRNRDPCGKKDDDDPCGAYMPRKPVNPCDPCKTCNQKDEKKPSDPCVYPCVCLSDYNPATPTMYDCRKYGHMLPSNNVMPCFEPLHNIPTGIFRCTDGEVLGRGASKCACYKNPEYFSFHHMTFFDMHLILRCFRNPCPKTLRKP